MTLDVVQVGLAATVVFSYASLLPAGLFGFLWWVGGGQASAATISFLELVCLYGYSLTIYIPVSLLWLIQVMLMLLLIVLSVVIQRSPWLQISWWQWLCVLLGAGLSGVVLFTPIWPAVRHQAARSAAIVMVVIVTLHLLLAVGFMLYFFHVPAAAAAGPHNSTEVAPPAAGDSNNTLEVQQQQAAEQKASVQLQEAEPTGVKKEEDVKRSTEEDNPEAKKISETPLAGSEQEAKQDTSKKEDIVEENHDNKSEKQPIASET